MNKQLINKYKPEFDYWLNGGELLLGYKSKVEPIEWKILVEDDWDYCTTKHIIIINDEYSIYRKALAEGKTIQLNGTAVNGETWNDCNKENLFIYGITAYRIKPDEPKFKVGDFVTHESLKITRQITKVDDDFIYFKEGSWALPHVEGFINKLILWTPVKGEWCWFYDDLDSKYSHLAQFYDMNISEDNSLSTFMSSPITKWYYCEPFLNSRPSHLKDK